VDFVNDTALKEAISNDTSVEMASTLYFEHEEKHYRIHHAICVKEARKIVSVWIALHH